jgi:hypothetical protein
LRRYIVADIITVRLCGLKRVETLLKPLLYRLVQRLKLECDELLSGFIRLAPLQLGAPHGHQRR